MDSCSSEVGLLLIRRLLAICVLLIDLAHEVLKLIVFSKLVKLLGVNVALTLRRLEIMVCGF
jgi:hypothetical protein